MAKDQTMEWILQTRGCTGSHLGNKLLHLKLQNRTNCSGVIAECVHNSHLGERQLKGRGSKEMTGGDKL